MAANAFGCVLGNFLTGATVHLIGSWPIGFYLWAVIGSVWCVLFALWAYSSPAVHPFITDREKAYLEGAIGTYCNIILLCIQRRQTNKIYTVTHT